MDARRIEMLAGVLSGILGLVALGISLFAPLVTSCVDTLQGRHECTSISLMQAQGAESLSFAITLFGALSLAVLIFTVLHSLTLITALLGLLWACTALFYLFMLLALVASIAGTKVAQQSRPAHS